jgi:hypothetical protein
LLEVILALAILCGSLAVLGEAIRLGMRNAQIARDTTEAQLLCQSKLAEITAGITAADPVQRVAFEYGMGDGRTVWLYSINLTDTEEEGLDLVCVTVTQDVLPQKKPIEVSLFRWIPDAGPEASLESETESYDAAETGQ